MIVRHNDIIKSATSQLGRNISQDEIVDALCSNYSAINKRASRNSKYSDAEVKIIENKLGIKIEPQEQSLKDDNKKKLIDIINEISAEKREKITREQIGDVFGVSRQRITAMLDKPLPPHRLKQLEDVFCMSISDTIEKHLCENSTTPEEFIDIPVRGEVSASCGNGICIYNENQTAIYPLPYQLFRALGASKTEAEIIFATGDSMNPEIKDGDALLVDKSKTEIIDGQIYIIRYDGQPFCKRLQKLPERKIKVISDNEKYDAYYIDFSREIEIDFAVIGRVLWYSRIAR